MSKRNVVQITHQCFSQSNSIKMYHTPLVRRTRSQPAAAAQRKTVPIFPASRTLSHIRNKGTDCSLVSFGNARREASGFENMAVMKVNYTFLKNTNLEKTVY